MTELWFRNPHNYVRELAECGGPFRVAWDRGMLVKKRIDPHQHGNLYFGEHEDWQALVIGEQGTAHIDSKHSLKRPLAVYPTWSFGEDFKILEEMVSSPIGEDVDACSFSDLPPDETPVLGQPHRVILANLPNPQISTNRPFYRTIAELQEQYPECIMIIHGSYSFRVMFGMGFGGADVECRQDAAQGRVKLPNGKNLAFARTVGQRHWLNLMGMSVVDLKVPRNRCIFNIKAARWAAEHFNEDIKFRSKGHVVVDPDSPVDEVPEAVHVMSRSVKAGPGDKITCDTCSLFDSCKYAREGAVCSVPGSETSPLAKAFQSRDSGRILDGLGTILAAQTTRLEKGMESEEEFGELDPEVTKLMNNIFANGVKLAKLVDPALTKPLVQINNGSTSAVAGASPREITAAVVRALEDQGIDRKDITEPMFEAMLRKMAGIQQTAQPPAIQGQVIE